MKAIKVISDGSGIDEPINAETVEEAAFSMYKKYHDVGFAAAQTIFIAGANWQAQKVIEVIGAKINHFDNLLDENGEIVICLTDLLLEIKSL